MIDQENNRKFIEFGFAKIDIDREERRGLPEIIYAPKKSTQQLKKIIEKFKNHTKFIFVSRLEFKHYKTLKRYLPGFKYFKKARLGFLGEHKKDKKGYVLIITAGTSDIDVAEEAAVFLEITGNHVERIYDVGAAGIHRLNPFIDKIKEARVIIVAAGMEAALLSIVSGLAKSPVIGIPTSVGYGASFKGLTALLGMLNCCSPGVVVVNIDNGLGAGYFAHLINKP